MQRKHTVIKHKVEYNELYQQFLWTVADNLYFMPAMHMSAHMLLTALLDT